MNNLFRFTTQKTFCVCLMSVFAVAVFATMTAQASEPANANQDDTPKKELTIKEIMKKAHKPAKATEKIYLLKKVATGKATAEETKELHELYKKLAKLKPTKGDQASWDTKTKALVEAAKAAVDKDANYKTKLQKATNCAKCHKVHK